MEWLVGLVMVSSFHWVTLEMREGDKGLPVCGGDWNGSAANNNQ